MAPPDGDPPLHAPLEMTFAGMASAESEPPVLTPLEVTLAGMAASADGEPPVLTPLEVLASPDSETPLLTPLEAIDPAGMQAAENVPLELMPIGDLIEAARLPAEEDDVPPLLEVVPVYDFMAPRAPASEEARAPAEVERIDDAMAASSSAAAAATPPAEESASAGAIPSMRELAVFVMPSLGIWLSAPLLSLIDTSIVGLSSSVHQLAALAPSTKLCDYAAFFCTALGAATTNLAAEALAVEQPSRAKMVVASSLVVGLVLGVAMAVAMGSLAGPAMAAMLGAGGSAEVLRSATSYTAIRAIGYPAALMTMVLQAGFVAAKDTRLPLLAVPVVAGVNLVGDLLLVGGFGMGAVGAAWATTAALYANAAVLLMLWRRKLVSSFGGAGGLFKRPSGTELRALGKFAAPMLVALCARVYMGLSMTLSAVALGTTALAANQIIDSLYWLFCPLGEGMSLCMQAYLPALLLKGRSLARRLQRTTLRVAAALGLVAALGAAALPTACAGLFTTSSSVISTMGATAPALAFALGAYVLASATEGMLTARKELRFLAGAHALNTLGLTLLLSRVVRWSGCGLQHIWTIFALCNLLRYVEFTAFMRRSDAEAVADSQAWLRHWVRPVRMRVRAMRRRQRRHAFSYLPYRRYLLGL